MHSINKNNVFHTFFYMKRDSFTQNLLCSTLLRTNTTSKSSIQFLKNTNLILCYYKVGLMRNGKLLAEDRPQKLIDIYRINVSISAENFIFKSDNNKNIVPLL